MKSRKERLRNIRNSKSKKWNKWFKTNFWGAGIHHPHAMSNDVVENIANKYGFNVTEFKMAWMIYHNKYMSFYAQYQLRRRMYIDNLESDIFKEDN